MKVVILAGGLPSTISEDKQGIPKPMVEIGENPILWHIMKGYSAYGLNDFIICAGYKNEMIKDYFNDYYIYQSDITVDLKNNTIEVHKEVTEDWKVTVVDTGLYASTGARVNQIQRYIDEDEFIVHLGDTLTDLDLDQFIQRHREQGKMATMMVAHPAGRNRIVEVDDGGAYLGIHKHDALENQTWVNGGVYLFNRQIFLYLMSSYQIEKQFLDVLAQKKQITTFRHTGFWSPIETKRDKEMMENMWNAQIAPWKNW